MAAEQSIPLCEDKTVVVVPTKTIPQGITAMLNFDPEGEVSDIVEAMNESLGDVHTAQVTYAARDSDFDGYAIHAGEYLALLDGKLIGSFTEMPSNARQKCPRLSAILIPRSSPFTMARM